MLNQAAYDAMMKAADFIEANPDRYDFLSVYTPGDRAPSSNFFDNKPSYGCMIGWTGHFLEMGQGVHITAVCRAIGVSEGELYNFERTEEKMYWHHKAVGDAARLRAFASAHRPREVV